PGFRWLHESFGTNWRMTEMQAVIGRLQIQRMAHWQSARLSNAQQIWATAREMPGLRVPIMPETIGHAAYKCYVFVEVDALAPGWDRDTILAAIVEQGVPCFSGSCSEVYLEKAFDGSGYRPENRLPVAKELGETSLMFLVHPTLTESEMAKTCSVLSAVMTKAARTS
ncbi:MAG TPA: DegT/DnrJ/EryC1/StrS family aminotransferase, partial [Marinobacter sp.]|nr:DegT/DnrJ/EryC1/StrS family aminotransferase [Marinobacter sp.]